MRAEFLLVLVVTIAGCGRDKKKFADDTCTTQETEDGSTITCPDGTSSAVHNGRDGSAGTPGRDGESVVGPRGERGERGVPGTSVVGPAGPPGKDAVLEVINPCGINPDGSDEVLLRLSTGQIEAWYEGVGNCILHPGVTYQTTDSQHCVFAVDEDGEVTW